MYLVLELYHHVSGDVSLPPDGKRALSDVLEEGATLLPNVTIFDVSTASSGFNAASHGQDLRLIQTMLIDFMSSPKF